MSDKSLQSVSNGNLDYYYNIISWKLQDKYINKPVWFWVLNK